MSEKDPVVDATRDAIDAARRATGGREVLTLIALAHAYSACREACMRDARTSELLPHMARVVAQVDTLMKGLRQSYSEAAEIERVDREIANHLDEHTGIRVLSALPAAKGAA